MGKIRNFCFVDISSIYVCSKGTIMQNYITQTFWAYDKTYLKCAVFNNIKDIQFNSFILNDNSFNFQIGPYKFTYWAVRYTLLSRWRCQHHIYICCNILIFVKERDVDNVDRSDVEAVHQYLIHRKRHQYRPTVCLENPSSL